VSSPACPIGRRGDALPPRLPTVDAQLLEESADETKRAATISVGPRIVRVLIGAG
jgi:hypothetical protein